MSSQERRVSPRKECFVPVRFNGHGPTGPAVRLTDSSQEPATRARFGMLEGEAVNLSERGIYFVCRDVTGRAPESIPCRARIVHAEQLEGKRNSTAAGAIVDHFEALARARARASESGGISRYDRRYFAPPETVNVTFDEVVLSN